MKEVLGKIWRSLHLSKDFQLMVMRRMNDQFLVGVTGIIVNEKDQILLFFHTYRTNQWSLPGGYLKAKEHPKEGLEREVKEESGFIISADKRIRIRTDRDTARLDIVYFGKFIGGTFTPSAEVTKAEFFSFEDLPLITRDQLILIQEALKHK